MEFLKLYLEHGFLYLEQLLFLVLLKHPVATLVGSVGGKVGSKLVDKTSKALTGQDYSTNVGNVLGISKEAAEYTNPGIYAGGYGAIRRLLNSIYTNITPLGYANMNTVRGIPITKLTKSQELANAVKDFLFQNQLILTIQNGLKI